MRRTFLALGLLLACEGPIETATPGGGAGQGGGGGDGAGGEAALTCAGGELPGTWLTYGVEAGDACVLHALDASDRELAPIPLARGMLKYLGARAWSPDGCALAYRHYSLDEPRGFEVLLARFDEAGLSEDVSVAAGSGELTDGFTGSRGLEWAHDSRSFAFAVADWDAAVARVVVHRQDLGTTWSLELDPPYSQGRIATMAPDGTSLFYSHGDQLVVATIGPEGLESPRIVAAGLPRHDGFTDYAPAPQWLSDLDTFVYASVDAELVAVTLTGSEPEVAVLSADIPLGEIVVPGYLDGIEYQFSVHPRDAGAVYVGQATDALDVYWVSFAGAGPVDLSGPEREAGSYVASPVGDAVAVFSEHAGWLTVAHAGEAPEPLSVDVGAVNGTAVEWTSDGTHLLIWAFDDVGAERRWVVPYQPGVGSAHGLGAPISIDGVRSVRSVPGANALLVVEETTGALQLIPFTPDGLEAAIALSAADHRPTGAWISPDGRGLLYLHEWSGERSLYWASLDEPGSPPMLVVSRPDLGPNASISPDGSAYWIEERYSDPSSRLLVGAIVDGSPTSPVEVSSALCARAEWR